MNNNKKKKLINSIPMALISNKQKYKIGKISEIIEHDKCQIDSENIKLIERKNNNQIKYSGSLLAEQQSKYIILTYNKESKQMDVIPADKWYSFKKDIKYQTLTSDEIEAKAKEKNPLIDAIKLKNNIGLKTKMNIIEDFRSKGKPKLNNINEDDDFEEEKFAKPEAEEKEEFDNDLKEIDSDIEELKGNKKDISNKKDLIVGNDSNQSDSNDSILSKQEEDDSDLDDSASDYDKKLNDLFEADNNDFLGNKRKAEFEM